MCAQTFAVGDPYRLTGNRLAFTGWHHVCPGTFGWFDSEGRDVTVHGESDERAASIRRFDHPWGIRLVVRPAVRSGPLFRVERPWEEGGFMITTMLQDGPVYKAWGSTDWGSSLPDKGERYITYYESDDGIHWRRPDCCQVNYPGWGAGTNLLSGGTGYGGTVFIDPTSEQERYKCVAEGHFDENDLLRYLQRRPNEAESICRLGDGRVVGIQGAVSPDGLRWTALPDPLVATMADTLVTGYYDRLLGKYVVYSREWSAVSQTPPTGADAAQLARRYVRSGRRAINRAESADFRNFPVPVSIVEPDPLVSPSHVLYTNCRTAIPGAPDQHLMFPATWTVGDADVTYLNLYSSHNGQSWSKLSAEPVLTTASFGEWDGGCLFAVPNLLELPGGDYALPYTGWNVPHKYPRARAAKRNVGYALWPKGRLAGIAADEYGEFATVALIPPGSKLRLNAVTERAGSIAVEAADWQGRPIAGRDFASVVPVTGDAWRTPVVWKEHDHIGVGSGEAVILRFRLDRAVLYGLEFE